MSLINDALKKAQQQRAQDGSAAPPAARPEQPAPANGPTPAPAPAAKPAFRYAAVPPVTRYIPPTAPNRNKRPAPRKKAYATGATVAVVTVCIGITSYLLLSDSSPEEPAEAPAATESTPNQIQPAPFAAPTLAINSPSRPTGDTASTPAEPAPPPTISMPALPEREAPRATTTTPAAAATLPTASLSLASPAQPAPAVAQIESTAQPATPSAAPPNASPAPASATASTASSPSPLPSIYMPRAPTTINPAARAQNFIDRLRVSGVRFTATGSKVILNDRLFQETEVVDSGLGLRLVKIEPGALTFVDAQGRTYLKLFQ